ncbi:MAG: shikimate dehydrogenase, partial [Betaproteobacteria bacterium]|nr:shikimate dehydrogenase [Betaproteobacteria bacterium]
MSDHYAVIGNPIGHSRSPLIHGAFAKTTGQDLEYTAIEGPLDGFAAVVHSFRANGGRGLNVTAPFKLQAFELATDKLERAQLAGAANALKFERDRVFADNFDGVGLVNDIQRNLSVALKGKRVLMLGAGGAARGALLPFLAEQPAELTIANRTVEKAQELARAVGAGSRIVGCGYRDIAGRFDIVVNATSASLKGELPPIAPKVFSTDALAYDLVYGKGLTPFLRLAQNAGVKRLADGVGMLVEQAAEAFVWWRGIRPQTRTLIDKLTVNKTRIAVAGAGYIGLAHIGVAQKSPTCTLSAIVDPAPAATDIAGNAGVPLYASLDELFREDRPDGVVLATPNQLHVEHALHCIA